MTRTKKITILLAEDHVVVRQGLRALLQADGGFLVLGEAKTGREAVEATLRFRPDIVVMDIAMPVLNGLEATRQIVRACPKAKVLILSAHSSSEYVEGMIAAGAAGFLEKETSAEVLTKALYEVKQGCSFFRTRRLRLQEGGRANHPQNRDGSPNTTRLRLTSRETQVLQLVAEGSANKQIAGELDISVKTVEKHRQHLMDKLNIHETAGLTRYAIDAGIIQSRVRLTMT